MECMARLVAPQGSVNWAGYFNGDVTINGLAFCNLGLWSGSDEALKTNVQPLTGALESLGQLTPSTYTFLHDVAPAMALPEGLQAGLLAQQLEGVFPQLVRDAVVPAEIDSTGLVVNPAFTYKAVNYPGLIPYMIAGIQELRAENQSLRDLINTCCATGSTDGRSPQQPLLMSENNYLRAERLLIQPNPIADQTLVRYYIAKEGRARLELSAEDGRLLDVLREERTTAGEHSYDWNTSNMAAGSYLLALMVDGNVIVKKVVKVGDR